MLKKSIAIMGALFVLSSLAQAHELDVKRCWKLDEEVTGVPFSVPMKVCFDTVDFVWRNDMPTHYLEINSEFIKGGFEVWEFEDDGYASLMQATVGGRSITENGCFAKRALRFYFRFWVTNDGRKLGDPTFWGEYSEANDNCRTKEVRQFIYRRSGDEVQ